MSLSGSYTFVGKGNWSLDATSGSATGGGEIDALVPTGSRIEKAFLYESTFDASQPAGSVTLSSGSSSVSVSDFTDLGANGFLEAHRADVTSFVSQIVGSGSANGYAFNVGNIVGNNSVDGYALVIVYSNPNETNRTISLLDGFSASSGDNFTLNFGTPLNPDANFSAQMSLGIGFGFQPSGQYSTINVNGRPLTSSAGGQDDGVSNNGGLITIGGIGDSPTNPTDPTANDSAGFRTDDELYNLALGNGQSSTPFVKAGDTVIKVDTLNPSNDDNIFFAGFNITSKVVVDSNQNDAPVAVGDSGAGFVTTKGKAFTTASVLANDFDPDQGDSFTLKSFDASKLHGTLKSNGDGTFVYTPDASFVGTDTFTYTIADKAGLTSTAQVDLTVSNTAPPSSSGGIIFGDQDLTPNTISKVSDNGHGLNDKLQSGYANGAAYKDYQQFHGGDGSDTFILRAKDFGGETAYGGISKYITDFQGAGGYSPTNNDFLALNGFGSGSTLTYETSRAPASGGPDSIDVYKIHSASTGQDYEILVHSLNGKHLAASDFAFYG